MSMCMCNSHENMNCIRDGAEQSRVNLFHLNVVQSNNFFCAVQSIFCCMITEFEFYLCVKVLNIVRLEIVPQLVDFRFNFRPGRQWCCCCCGFQWRFSSFHTINSFSMNISKVSIFSIRVFCCNETFNKVIVVHFLPRFIDK